MVHLMKTGRILTLFVPSVPGSTGRMIGTSCNTTSMAVDAVCSGRVLNLKLSCRNPSVRPPVYGFFGGHKTMAVPSVLGSSLVRCFDKMPTRLPSWWDDEDDEDDDSADGQKLDGAGVNEDSVDAGLLTNSRLMQTKMAMDGSSGSTVSNRVPVPGGSVPSGGGGVFDNEGGSGSGGRGSGRGRRRDDGESGDKGDDESGNMNDIWFLAPICVYLRLLSKRPLLTKAITSSVLGIIGDALAQWISRRRQVDADIDPHAHSWRRTFAISLLGLVLTGPALHAWYGVLNRRVVGRFSLMKKLALDQLVFCPIFNVVFSIALPTLEGHRFVDNVELCKQKFWTVMKANWMLFPPAQVFNFSLVPLDLQPVFSNTVGLVWNILITYILHDDEDEKPPAGVQIKGVTS